MSTKLDTIVSEEQDHVDRKLADLCGDLPDLDMDVEGIVERIQGIDRRLRIAMEETLEGHDLSYGEWKLLCALRRAPGASSTPGELSTKLELSSGAMTNRIDRLERAGYVGRRPDPTDRRGVRVDLTDSGDTVWVESTNAQAIKEAMIAGALSKDEQHALNALLRKLMLSFERASGG
ncbi:MAG TPA: MarR family transcriptional regulator [Gaiellaceae bacterium]|jgi:DNA-binding MarR family transcriptional regulator|nr:MarR family transcriptional regulator [Gaiellaceae bacterium]